MSSKKSGSKLSLETRRKLQPYYYIAPVMIILLIMFGYPLIKSIIMSFQEYKLSRLDKVAWNDFENYAKMFGDKRFWLLVKNSLVYVIASVGGQFLLGMGLALGLNSKFKGRGIYQSIVFLPWAFSAFVIGLLFRWSFNGEYGVINDILKKIGLIDKGISWLGTPGLSLMVIVFAMIWIGIPFFAINILAALQSVPSDVYEAADMDGCGMFRKFFTITIPYIKPTIITTILLRTIWIFNSFDLVVIVTEGGPASYSETLPSYMYTQAFASYDFGLAGAFGVLLMVVLTTYALIYLRLTKYDEAGDF